MEEISEKTGLKPITIRHHLRTLREIGFITSQEARDGRVGRPKVKYVVTKTLPPLYYPGRLYIPLLEDIVEKLVNTLGEEKAKLFFREIGGEMAFRDLMDLSTTHRIDEWTPQIFGKIYVEDHLSKKGAIPEIVCIDDRRIIFRINNCLFHELACKRPTLFCDGLEEGYYAKVSKSIGGNILFKRRKSIGMGDNCCELEIIWQ